MYKKIALATLIIAPLLAQFASNWTRGPVAPPLTSSPPVVTDGRLAATPKPAAIQYSAIPQSSATSVAAGPFDPVPTLDPNAIVNAPPVAAPQAAVLPVSQEPPPSRHNTPDDPERF